MKLKMTARDLPLQHGILPKSSVRPQNRAKRTLAQFQEEATDYSATGALGRVTLHLSTHYYASFGEQLKLVGNVPELGDWDVEVAPSLQWTSDHYWEANVDLPTGADVQFKVVLLSHSGVVWEPGLDRQLKAEAQPGKSAIAVRVAWGIPEVQVADPVEAVTGPSAADSLAEQFDNLWDPTRAGLPADITSDLETPTVEVPLARESRQKHVTLEPEWAIFDGEEKDDKAEEPDEERTEAASDIFRETSANDTTPEIPEEEEEKAVAAPQKEEASVVAPQIAAATATAELAPGEAQQAPGTEQLVKKKKQTGEEKPKLSGLQAAGKAAGYAAAGVAAAVVMSALAVDVTDAAIASAVMAAGATFLPSAMDPEGKKQAHKGKGAASPVLGALEIGLKAQALVRGISGVAGKKDSSAAASDGAAAVPVEEEPEEELLPSESERLDAYIEAKATEAKIFAATFFPTEEELFETSPSNYNKDVIPPEIYANNAVPADGFHRKAAADAEKKEEVADKQ